MCRWAGYIGAPIYLSDILSAPEHSLIEQSRAADEGKARLNGNGFGIAWYGKHTEPGLYKDVNPAWSDVNLRSVANQVQSHLFLHLPVLRRCQQRIQDAANAAEEQSWCRLSLARGT